DVAAARGSPAVADDPETDSAPMSDHESDHVCVPRRLSLELRAALFMAMRGSYIGEAAFARMDTSGLADMETLVFLGLVEPIKPGVWHPTDAGWQWVIGTGLWRGEGLEGVNAEEAWSWTALGDVLEHIKSVDETGSAEWAHLVEPDRWRRGVCASRARAARRARRRPPEGGGARA